MISINQLRDKVLGGGSIDKQEALFLAYNAHTQELEDAAHSITESMAATKFDLCSIINARSGRCSENCAWCAQSAHFKTGVENFGYVGVAKVLEAARLCDEQSIHRFSIVTSGRGERSDEFPLILQSVEALRKQTNLKVCASLGLLSCEQFEALYNSGVRRYHCNLETSEKYFPNLCSTHTFQDKVRVLNIAREVGFKVCSGGIIGMGESMEDRIDMAFSLREVGADSIPLNILQPIKGTPLENAAPLSDDELVRTVAIYRFIHPSAYLRFAGGRSTISESALRRALRVGVNAAIVGDLLTTLGSSVAQDKVIFKEAGYEL